MRLAMAQPCFGSSEMVLRISKSRVPWTRSVGFAMLPRLSTFVDAHSLVWLASSSYRFTQASVQGATLTVNREFPGGAGCIIALMRFHTEYLTFRTANHRE